MVKDPMHPAIVDTTISPPLGSTRLLGASDRTLLTLPDAIAQSLCVGPIFCASLISVLVVPAAGIVTPLAMAIATVGLIALGWILSLYARRYVGAGSMYHYIRSATNPIVGLGAAGVYFASALFLGMPTLSIIAGLFAEPLLQTIGITIPWWVVSLIVIAWCSITNYIGARVATRTQLILTVVSALPIGCTALIILLKGGNGGSVIPQTFDLFHSVPSGVLRGIFFAVTLFSGIESAAALGEETAEPRRTIPRAIIGAVLLTGLFYIFVSYASAVGFGVEQTDVWGSDPIALDTLATRYVGTWMAQLIDLAIIMDLIAMSSAFTALTARGLFALAQDGLLPISLSRTSRFGTPVVGTVFVLVVSLLAIAITALTNTDPTIALYIGAGAGGILLLAIYTALALIAIRFIRGTPGPWWRWPVLIIAALAPASGLYGALVPFPDWPVAIGIYGALVGVVLSIVWMIVIRAWYPERLKRLVATDRVRMD